MRMSFAFFIFLFVCPFVNWMEMIKCRSITGNSDAMLVRGWFDGNVLDDRGAPLANHGFNSCRSLSTDGHNEYRRHLHLLYERHYDDVYR